MKIGTLAARVGVSIDTIRFYERTGVIPKASRTGAGYRMYDEQAYRTLVVVRWAQGLGLPLEAIADFFRSECQGPEARLLRLQTAISTREEEIREEKARLQRAEQELAALAKVPFAGECLLPAPFVDGLIARHESEAHSLPEPRRKTGSAK